LTGYATTAYVDDEVSANGVSLQAFASNASNLSNGTVSDDRLSANVPLKNASNTYTGSTQTFGVAGTSNGQIVVGAAVSISAKITIGGSSNLVLSGANNGLGATWQIITDTTGSNGPAVIRLGSTGSFGIGNSASNVGTVDTSWVRNATGPAFETRAAGGLKVCNTDGSATEKVVCSEIRTSTYRDNSGTRHLQFGGYFVQSDQQIFINAKPLTFGAITKTALLAKSPHVINEGVYRITDSTPAQRLAYPDGTNWRYASDDTIVT
jgi:hypothetical protein